MNNAILEANGYILIRGILSQSQLNDGLACIKEDEHGNQMLSYVELKNNFIDKHFIANVNQQLQWNAIYNKFRFSDKSNSRDAATFHADVYNFTEQTMPIYTGLAYFDTAILEIIPGSHKRTDNMSTAYLYDKRVKIQIEPGDMLIFNSNMYHRGVFYKTGTHARKLLQIFDIYSDMEMYFEYRPQYLTVLTNNGMLIDMVNNFNELTSKYEGVNEFITYIHLWLVNNNIQYSFMTYNTDKKYDYYGYIPGSIDYMRSNSLQPWNVNIYIRQMTNMSTSNYYRLYIYIVVLVVLSIILYKICKTKRR